MISFSGYEKSSSGTPYRVRPFEIDFDSSNWTKKMVKVVQIAFHLAELFQIGINAVIYTDQFTSYIGTWTRRLKFIAILKAALG